MTYALFLLVFLCLPIAALAVSLRGRITRRHGIACAIVCGLAFVYTSPWDNHAAKTKLWTFDTHFAPPSHFVFFLPWEEYAFYLSQGILICLLVTALSRYLRPVSGGGEL
jgi:lycopene cyclase domain-containing protein